MVVYSMTSPWHFVWGWEWRLHPALEKLVGISSPRHWLAQRVPLWEIVWRIISKYIGISNFDSSSRAIGPIGPETEEGKDLISTFKHPCSPKSRNLREGTQLVIFRSHSPGADEIAQLSNEKKGPWLVVRGFGWGWNPTHFFLIWGLFHKPWNMDPVMQQPGCHRSHYRDPY